MNEMSKIRNIRNIGRTAPLAILLVIVATLAGGSLGCNRDESSTESAAAHGAEFCAEHQIAEARCPFCNPGLIESMGQCAGHGVPEALCYQCNPELIAAFKAVGDWCDGHDRPESQCYICNPQFDPARTASPEPAAGDAPSNDHDLDHAAELAAAEAAAGLPRFQHPPSVHCGTQDLVIRFDNPQVVEEVDFQFATVVSRPITKTVESNALVDYDRNRYAHIAAQLPGIIAEVHTDLGARVEKGEALVTVTSASLGAAKATYLQAVAAVNLWERNHTRENGLFERGVSTERDLLEAETRLAESRIARSAAEQALISLGMSQKTVDEVGRTGDTSARYVITAPLPGVVVERHAVVGEVVDPARLLFAIADVSRMWAILDVYEADLREIREGQPVVLHAEGLPGETFGGQITWVNLQLDPRTHTLQARAEFDNERGLLRANMFARASIAVRDRSLALVVPRASVQWEGCCNVVFVRTAATTFEPRKVQLGVATDTVYEVLDGLNEGDVVVTQGSFLLKTELLKGSIGAGCCEVQPGT